MEAVPLYIVPVERKPKPFELVQEALGFGEQAVLATLRRLAGGSATSPKRVVVGIGRLAPLVPMSYNNCAAAVKSLVRKQAMQDRGARGNAGREFYLPAYDDVLQNWRAQGLTHVIRLSRGIALSNETGTTIVGSPEMVATITGTPAIGTPVSITGTPVTAEKGVPVTGTPSLRTYFKKKNDDVTSSSPQYSVICETARKRDVALDDDAVRKLIRRCRDEDPAATEDEIAAFLDIKCRQLRNSPPRNMVGMLLSAVPAYFAKPATELALYRQQRVDEHAKQLEIARAVLESPESSPQDREWARDVISGA